MLVFAGGCAQTVGPGADGGADAVDVATTMDAAADTGTTDSGATDDGALASDGGNDDAARGDTGSTDDAGSTDDGGITNDAGCVASLRAIQTNIFQQRCASTRCHNAGFFAAELDLTAVDIHGQLVNVRSQNTPADVRVVPGDLDSSFLWRKLNNLLPTDGSEGDPMPTGEAIRWTPIPDNEMQQIRCWILSGAPDN